MSLTGWCAFIGVRPGGDTFDCDMSLLSISGLKKTYESLEGEITRTFDSSRAAEPTETAAPVPTDETSTGTEKVATLHMTRIFFCRYVLYVDIGVELCVFRISRVL